MKSFFRSIRLRRQEAQNPIAGSPEGMVYYPKSYENFAACPADLDIAGYLAEREGGLPGVNPDRSRYAPLDDRSLLDLVVGKLVPGGRLLIYTGSHGAEVTRQLLAEEISRKQRLAYSTTHGSIAIYTKVN